MTGIRFRDNSKAAQSRLVLSDPTLFHRPATLVLSEQQGLALQGGQDPPGWATSVGHVPVLDVAA